MYVNMLELREKGHRIQDCLKLANKPPPPGPKKGPATHIAYVYIGGSATNWDLEFWIADSGASEHMTPLADKFVNFQKFPEPTHVRIGDGTPLEATGFGDIKLQHWRNDAWQYSVLKNVWLVPKLDCNLYST